MTTLKQIAHTFLTMISSGAIEQAFDQYTDTNLIHHNQYTKPGRSALIDAMSKSHQLFPHKTISIDFTIQEADMVMVYTLLQFTPDHDGVRIVYILRFINDKIVEMRDVSMQLTEDRVNPLA